MEKPVGLDEATRKFMGGEDGIERTGLSALDSDFEAIKMNVVCGRLGIEAEIFRGCCVRTQKVLPARQLFASY